MTRSKIQKMKFFIFLLTFLLAQTAVCDGSFREKRDTPIVENKDKNKVGGTGAKIEPAAITSARKDAGHQQDVVGSSNDVKARPAADSVNRTHDDVISKPSTPAVAAADKTAHTANASDEVRILSMPNCDALSINNDLLARRKSHTDCFIIFQHSHVEKH